MVADALHSSRFQAWRTPPSLFRRLDQRCHFGLDAAADETNALCPAYLTARDNALIQSWGVRSGWQPVWLNPPYDQAGAFIAKARREGWLVPVVCLVPARTDTAWWQRHGSRARIYLLPGRLRFGGRGAGNTAPFPSALVSFAPGVVPQITNGWPGGLPWE